MHSELIFFILFIKDKNSDHDFMNLLDKISMFSMNKDSI